MLIGRRPTLRLQLLGRGVPQDVGARARWELTLLHHGVPIHT